MSLFRAYISSGKILNRNKRKHFYATKKALPERKVDCVLTVESLESERKKGIFFLVLIPSTQARKSPRNCILGVRQFRADALIH